MLNGFILSAQQIAVRSIEFDGLRKTKSYILLRELSFNVGDSLDLGEIAGVFEFNEYRIQNTGLIVEAQINMKNMDLTQKQMDIQISVKEAWYIYPAPILEFLDNDPNKWWYNYKLALDKLSYGFFVKHINLSGNADILTTYAQLGFTRKLALQYNFPYLNKAKTFGAGLVFFHARNRDIAYNNVLNKLHFYRDAEKDMLIRTKAGVNFTYRPGFAWTYILNANFFNMTLNPVVRSLLNPDFLPLNKQFVSELALNIIMDTRDIRPYPLSGIYLNNWVNRTGYIAADQIHLFNIGTYNAFYHPLNNKWSVVNIVSAGYNLDRGKTAYFFTKTLGYNDESLRGYENYVMNGQDFAFSRNSIRFLSLDRMMHLGKYMIFKSYQDLSFRVYLTGNFDLGYVNDRFYYRQNDFVNRLLYGGGLGLDFVFYYNKLMRIEYSINHTGEKGIYLHFDAGL